MAVALSLVSPLEDPRERSGTPGRVGPARKSSSLGFWGWAWQKGSLELWSGQRDG